MKKILVVIGTVLLTVSSALATRSRHYLETIGLKNLCIVFPRNHQGFWVANVKDPNGFWHTVTVGDFIGKNFGRITKITSDTVEVHEVVQDGQGEWIERPLTLEVGCPGIPPSACSPSDGSPIVWLMGNPDGKKSIYLGLSVGDRRAWRWVYGSGRGIQPATSEEAKELEKLYGDWDLSRERGLRVCPTPH